MATDIRVVANGAEERALLVDNIVASRLDDRPIRVLEAGCGQRWALDVGDVPLHITGVDTDRDALAIRREQHGDLDAEVHGDLRTVDLTPDWFDVAYCSFVLEHVHGAEDALDRMGRALRPGGRMIIRVPDGQSVYGFFVRHSPHRVHVLYKKYVERFPDAGKPGHAPYPTVYEPVVSVTGMRTWAAANGMQVVAEYASNTYLNVFGKARPAVQFVIRVVARLSRGRLAGTHNNIGFVLRKL